MLTGLCTTAQPVSWKPKNCNEAPDGEPTVIQIREAVAETEPRNAAAEPRRGFGGVRNQYIAICCANIITLSQGCAIGWMSPTLLVLISADRTPLADGPISIASISWIASTSSIGAACGAILFGWLCGRLGSRTSTWLCAFPLAMFWLIVMYADHAWQICLGRFLSGSTGGAFVCIQLFLADISDERIRGRLGALMSFFLNVGILGGYSCGTYMSYETIPYVMIVGPVLFIVAFLFVPETPQYLLGKGDVKGAEKALRFYSHCPGKTGENVHFMKEFDQLQSVIKARDKNAAFRWDDFCNPSAIRALIIGPILLAVNQFSGSYLIVIYAARIFQHSGSDFDPHISAMCLGGLQIVGTYMTSMCIDRVGRKALLIVSATGTALGLASMVAYTHLSANGFDVSSLRLVPVISLSFVTVIASLGLGSVPYVIIAEVLPQKIRNIGTTFCTLTVSVYAFTALKSYPYLEQHIGLPNCMTLFLCVASAGLLFIVLCVPETMGRRLHTDEEQKHDESPKTTNECVDAKTATAGNAPAIILNATASNMV